MCKTAIVLFTVLFLASCSSVKVTTYSDNSPKLVLDEFFSGKLSAHGIVKNRSGKVIRYFNADLNAYKDGETLILDEDFVFDDGEEQKRVWRLNKVGDQKWTGTAGDVTGTGELEISGNALFFNYVLQVPYKGKTIEVNVDDRMYLVDDKTIINETKMTKFGFRVGSVLLTIVKE